jgi:hypothetical protein
MPTHRCSYAIALACGTQYRNFVTVPRYGPLVATHTALR